MENWQLSFDIFPANTPNEGEMFVNHEPASRSGHMGHAMVEYAPGKVLAFYPNCSDEDQQLKGHSGHGWMEYKRSLDGGKTWSDPIIEPNSKRLFDSGCGRTMMCEKAVSPSENEIILFYLTCDMLTNGHIWEPYYEPQIAYSHDGGETFSECEVFVREPGRIYDACIHNGVIYVLFFANPELPGVAHLQEHQYRLYVSTDNGKTFQLRSVLPFQSTKHCFYGNFVFTPDNRLMVYIYDELDEHNLKFLESSDEGRTWGTPRRIFFAKKIRNPQIVYFEDRYFMHGRSGSFGENAENFVLYTSPDGKQWDEGTYLFMKKPGCGAGSYSNNVIAHMPGQPRLLIQASKAYRDCRTNIVQYTITKKREKDI